jgi:2-polyprenyl-6-methoxyphenol hydroxylase-like FAD-dependent oxidoreductase
MRVGVIGAGIGGLVAAAGLQRDGHDVTVFERQEQPGAIGAGLSLFANAFAALDAVGLGEAVRSVTSDEVSGLTAGQRSPSGHWLTVLPQDAVASLRVLHRADLHRVLVESLRPGTLHTGSPAHVAPGGTPGAAPAITVDGRDEPFDLVVAADGVRSPARAALGLDSGLRYAGYTAWRGVTRGPVDVRGAAGETWGRGRRFGVVPLPGGRVYWFATQTLPPGTGFDDERQEVLRRFGSWHSPIRDLVEGTAAAEVLRHDLYDLAKPLSSFARGRVVLLGDAAHAMTPDLGQGAGQAIEDAATLPLLLRAATGGASSAADEHLDGAVRAYDRLRRPRSQSIARRSRAAGRVGQLSGPLAVGARDALLRATPARVAGFAARQVQRWTPPGPPPT